MVSGLRVVSVVDAIADNLRDGILAGELMPGTALTESDVAGRYDVARPTAKAALEKVKEASEAGLISPFSAWSPEWQGAFQRGQLTTALYGNLNACRFIVANDDTARPNRRAILS